MERSSFVGRHAAALLLAMAAEVRAFGASIPAAVIRPVVSAPGGKRKRKAVGHGGRTYHRRDSQNAASLRRRMGGNARRIREARMGNVWDDVQRRYVECPAVLYEEVEMALKSLTELAVEVHWARSRRVWAWIPGKIRGIGVEVMPTSCGPIRYREVSA